MSQYLSTALLANTAPAVEPWHWVAFGAFIVVLLIVDLVIFHRDSKEPTLRESALWTLVWCLIALAFNALAFLER